MTLELAGELAISLGLATMALWLRQRFQELRRDLRGLEALVIEHDAALVRLREALQQDPQQRRPHADHRPPATSGWPRRAT